MKKVFRWLVATSLWICFSGTQAESFIISDIQVEGLQRIAVGTVYSYLPVEIGDSFDEENSAEVIRALYRTGFFTEIDLERNDDILIIEVVERPAIAKIVLEGNKEIKDEELLEALRTSGLSEGEAFNPSLLERIEQELAQQYFARGKYGVQIETTVTPQSRNRVEIEIEIKEGRVAEIRSVNIVGNHVYTDKELMKDFQSTTPNLLSFFTKKGQYSSQQLSADQEALRSYYFDRGYIKFEIDSTQVSITPDKESVYITINVTENDQYFLESVSFSGNLLFLTEDELHELVNLKTGELFSRREVTAGTESIAGRLGHEGYAFTNINPVTDVNEETKTVRLNYVIDPGKRIYVRRINFVGNEKTADEVLRQATRQMESSWLATDRVDQSRVNLNRTGFFSNVQIDTERVPGSLDLVDLKIGVQEESAGNLTGGVGYSQLDGFIINAGLSQPNFLGTGRRVDFNFNRSVAYTNYIVSYNNPYHTIDGVSRGVSLFYREVDADRLNVSDYTTDRVGAALNYGIPINENNRFGFGYRYEHIKIKLGDEAAEEIIEYVDDHGSEADALTVLANWRYYTFDRFLFPTKGFEQQISPEVTVPYIDQQYYRARSSSRFYHPLIDDYVFYFKTNVGWGDSYANDDGLPFYQNFYAGGVNREGGVRGFRDNTLGPRDENDHPTGGNFRWTGSFELILPQWFYESDSLRTSLFVDFGNVWDTQIQNIDLDELRYSAGFALIWISPLGPLAFSIAEPLTNFDGDESEIFQFTIGTEF